MAHASTSAGTIKKVYERFTKRGTTESKPFFIATCISINGREHYYCNGCKTAPFSRKGDAKRHYYGHLGKEYIPHQCNVPGCNRLFIQSGALKDHIKYTHDGETIHCARCNEEFSNPSCYSRHQKIHYAAAQKTSRQRGGRRKNIVSASSDSAATSSRESTMDIVSSAPSSPVSYASPFVFSSSSRSTSISTSSFDAPSSSRYSYTSFSKPQVQVQEKTAEQMESEKRLEVAKILLEYSLSPSNW